MVTQEILRDCCYVNVVGARICRKVLNLGMKGGWGDVKIMANVRYLASSGLCERQAFESCFSRPFALLTGVHREDGEKRPLNS
jgi:hypothetical protein